ncbi:MAG: NAD(P)-dependent oxidoreductase [Candidatus Eisenbacteria bacterium]|nr:NAD(P)-dependent oxidoreductase [Candidatus Eisenbacteria bacterium]
MKSLKVGVIGLGTMGKVIASHIRGGGHLTAAYDRDPARYQIFNECACADIASLGSKCELAVLVLPDPSSVRSTMEELLSGNNRLKAVLDHSTVDPETAATVSQLCNERSLWHLQSPMFGGVRAAKERRLFLLGGGDGNVMERFGEAIRTYAPEIMPVADAWTAAAAKLVHNLVTLGNAAVAMEALVLGGRLGLSADSLLTLFARGTADSYVARNSLRRTLVDGDYSAGYQLYLARKDLHLAGELAHSAGISFQVLRSVMGHFDAAASADRLGTDYPTIYPDVADALSRRTEESSR